MGFEPETSAYTGAALLPLKQAHCIDLFFHLYPPQVYLTNPQNDCLKLAC